MINRIFSDMQTNVGNNIQDTSSATQTIIKRLINDAYFDVLRRYNWNFYNHDYSITTTAGTQDYALPRDFGKELYVLDDTNNLPLDYISQQRLNEYYPSTWNSTGTVGRYLILNKRVIAQPSSASVITVVSDAAGDTTQSIFVRGIVSGVEQTEAVVLTGTSSAATTKSFTRVISLSKSASTTGKVTVTSNSGAVTLASIAPEELDYQVKCIRFHEVPSGSIVVNVPYKIDPLPLNNDNDTPLIPADIVEQGATAHAWRYKRQMAKAQEWERLFEKNIISLIWDQENQLNQDNRIDVTPYSRETV